MRHSFYLLKAAGVVLLSLGPLVHANSLVAIAKGAATSEIRPNIIYINADDLGWMDLSCQGSKYYETPNIDLIAAEGMRFTDAYAPSANCAPSRACVLSGLYSQRHGVYTVGSSARGAAKDRKLTPTGNKPLLDDSIVTMAEALKAGGYKTIHLGKWHVGKDPLTQGFDINFGGSHDGGPYRGGKYLSPYAYPNVVQDEPGEHLTDRLGDEAVAFIKEHTAASSAEVQAEPFFMHFAAFAVHTPLVAKPELIELYDQKEGNEAHKSAVYAALIHSLDENVGRILQAVDDLGLSENTLVLFTSDNGGVYKISRQWPLRAGKGSYFEGGIRVPLLVKWKGHIQPGQISHIPVTGLDYYPTFLEAAGVAVPDGLRLDGDSLMPLLTNASTLEQRPLFWHFPIYLQAGNTETHDMLFRTRPGSAIRLGDWKLHEYFEGGKLELYNLKDDRGEKTNLAESHPEKVAELHALLKDWRKKTGAPVPTELNPKYNP